MADEYGSVMDSFVANPNSLNPKLPVMASFLFLDRASTITSLKISPLSLDSVDSISSLNDNLIIPVSGLIIYSTFIFTASWLKFRLYPIVHT